ncbi:MAG TPA: DUF951 domain-containing protein [Aggregatilineales bacterium]|nr:DUF951 domain-containing protein [Aggregatilineales bacterium]
MLDVQVGDIVTMRKTHPCGSKQWVVYRVGADIGLRCLGCERRQMMPRRKFEKAVRKIESSHEEEFE